MKALVALAAVLAVGVPDVAPNPRHRSGMDLAPRDTTEVAMRAEVVEVTLHEAHADVAAVFVLVNTSDGEESLEVGFPTAAKPLARGIAEGLHDEFALWDAGSIYAFVAKVDGERVEAERKSVDEDDPRKEHRDWICWPMHFAPRETMRVEVSYQVETKDALYVEPYSPLQPREVTYVLKTGRGWKDTIGSARVLLRTAGTITLDHVERTSPQPTARTEDTLEWNFEDFEPDADVTVRYRLYRDAADAVARIAPQLEEHPNHAELVLDWAENQAALGNHAEAAAAFARIATWREKVGLVPKTVFARCYERPAEYQAARACRLAGDVDGARRWIAAAIEVVDQRLASARTSLAHASDARKPEYESRVATLEKLRAELRTWSREGTARRE